ncbi:hypothetical protein ES703_17337 [subsurface metagenome]
MPEDLTEGNKREYSFSMLTSRNTKAILTNSVALTENKQATTGGDGTP